MKKIIALLLAATLTLSFASCKKDDTDADKENTESSAAKDSGDTSDDEPSDKPSDDEPSDKPSDDKPSDDKPSDDKPSDDEPSDDEPSDDEPAEDEQTPEEFLREYFDIKGKAEMIGEFVESMKEPTEDSAFNIHATLEAKEGILPFITSVDTDAATFYEENLADWLDSCYVDLGFDMDGTELWDILLGLGINDTHIMTLDMLIDFDAERLYYSYPDLTEKVVYTKFSDLMDEEFEGFTTVPEEVLDLIPSAETVSGIAERYLDKLCSMVKNVKTQETEISVGEVRQNVTELSFRINGSTVYETSMDILETLQKDDDVRKIVEDYAEYAIDAGIASDEYDHAEDIVDDFYYGISENMEDLRDSVKDMSDTDNYDFYIYLGEENSFHGIALEINQQRLEYLYAENNGKFALVLAEDDKEYLSGNGKVRNGLMSGTISDSDKSFEITIKDFDLDAFENGKFIGDFTLWLAPEMYSTEYFGIVTSALRDCKYNFVFDESKLTFSLLHKRVKAFSLILEFEEKESEDLKVPSGDVLYLENADPEDMEIDADKLIENLQAAGFPDDFFRNILGD